MIQINLKKAILIVMSSLIIFGPSYTLAANALDKHAYLYDTNFYDKDYQALESSCNSGGGSTLVGSDNVAKAYNYFIGKQLTSERSAAIVGNLRQESGGGIDPLAVQSPGPGRGIAQWSVGDRWDLLLAFAASQQRDPKDLGLQLDFMWKELTSTYARALTALNAANGIPDATKAFELLYEAAGDPQMANRITYAQEVYAKYGNLTPSGGLTATTTGTCGGGIGVNGAFTFPLKTSQLLITSHTPTWCYNFQVSCHHEYLAADIFQNEGTHVVVAVAGTVLRAVDTSCSGSGDFDVPRVQIKGSDGKYYYYTHMRPGSIKVSTGQTVTAGTELGVVGPTACAESTSPHLHFQMSNVAIQSTKDLTERQQYIDPQPNLLAAYKNLPAK